VRGELGFWQDFLNRVRARLDGAPVSEAALERLTRHFRDPASWRVYDDVFETLDRLAAAQLRLAVVSNWDSYLPELLRGLGLAGRFEQIAVSAIEQTGKPHPEIFRRVCERLDLEAAGALHVGDSLREDVEAARSAGLHALLLDRDDRHPQVEERIRSLAELPERIGRR
jgi:putative hydrolase of the HAD superfamily